MTMNIAAEDLRITLATAARCAAAQRALHGQPVDGVLAEHANQLLAELGGSRARIEAAAAAARIEADSAQDRDARQDAMRAVQLCELAAAQAGSPSPPDRRPQPSPHAS